MSLLLDIEEVRALVRGPEKCGLTGLELKDKLSTTAKVASALIKGGHLKTITVVNPVNRCPTVVVPAEEVDRFARETNMSDLNTAIADLRDREKKLRDAATAAKQGSVANSQEAIPLVGQGIYDAYKDKARDVAALFTDATGFLVTEPSLDPRMS